MAIYLTKLGEKIFEENQAVLLDMGYDIVLIDVINNNNKKVIISIERLDEKPINLLDCEVVTKHLKVMLYQELKDNYILEVSSVGINKPLTRVKDFQQNIGARIKLQTFNDLNGSKRFNCSIHDVKQDEVLLEINGTIVNVKFNNIKQAILQKLI